MFAAVIFLKKLRRATYAKDILLSFQHSAVSVPVLMEPVTARLWVEGNHCCRSLHGFIVKSQTGGVGRRHESARASDREEDEDGRRIYQRKKRKLLRERKTERARTWALGDVCGRVAGMGQAKRLGGVDLEPRQAGVVLVLDQHAQALEAGLHHGLEPRAAVRRRCRRRRLLLHVRQARRQAQQRVHALGSVRRNVAAHSRGRHCHRRDEEDERPTRIHEGRMEQMSDVALL
jgi:hypothetical protein